MINSSILCFDFVYENAYTYKIFEVIVLWVHANNLQFETIDSDGETILFFPWKMFFYFFLFTNHFTSVDSKLTKQFYVFTPT